MRMYYCSNCKVWLEPNSQGLCPQCGKKTVDKEFLKKELKSRLSSSSKNNKGRISNDRKKQVIPTEAVLWLIVLAFIFVGSLMAGNWDIFEGIIGPVKIISSIPKVLLYQTTDSSIAFETILEKTWGSGSTWYRVGFVFSAIILMLILENVGKVAKKRKQ